MLTEINTLQLRQLNWEKIIDSDKHNEKILKNEATGMETNETAHKRSYKVKEQSDTHILCAICTLHTAQYLFLLNYFYHNSSNFHV